MSKELNYNVCFTSYDNVGDCNRRCIQNVNMELTLPVTPELVRQIVTELKNSGYDVISDISIREVTFGDEIMVAENVYDIETELNDIETAKRKAESDEDDRKAYDRWKMK